MKKLVTAPVIHSLWTLAIALLFACCALPAWSQAATAEVQVLTEPAATSGLLRFSGMPAGEITLSASQNNALTAANLDSDSYASTLSFIDPGLLAAGYSLSSITCDDSGSPTPSIGSVASSTATFNIDADETVTCVFLLTSDDDSDDDTGDDDTGGNPDDDGSGDDGSGDDGTVVGSCICPEAGSWRVNNLPGQMVCTGVMSMTMPLAPGTGKGTIEIGDNCETLIASGLSEDEADITMHRTEDCGFKGSVGGERDGIPMVIDFTWQVPDTTHITGDLHSVVSQSGMNCVMSRNYEMNYAN